VRQKFFSKYPNNKEQKKLSYNELTAFKNFYSGQKGNFIIFILIVVLQS